MLCSRITKQKTERYSMMLKRYVFSRASESAFLQNRRFTQYFKSSNEFRYSRYINTNHNTLSDNAVLIAVTDDNNYVEYIPQTGVVKMCDRLDYMLGFGTTINKGEHLFLTAKNLTQEKAFNHLLIAIDSQQDYIELRRNK